MKFVKVLFTRNLCPLVAVMLWSAFLLTPDSAWAQAKANPAPAPAPAPVPVPVPVPIGGGGYYQNQRQVGGISIKADGLIENAGVDVQGKLSHLRAQVQRNVPAALSEPAPLRKISLRRLEAEIAAQLKTKKPLADEVVFLAGIQQIRYVFVYPEQKDIVLVGPAEGWKMDARGNVVGITTGQPVMHLDDLLVALRTAYGSARAGISCSIDPTASGIEQLRAHVSKLRTIGNPDSTAASIEQALGRQEVTFTGVPATSHFAAILVAADYRMKRLAMNFDPSPIRGFSSFLQMIGAGSRGMSNVMQRWWLEPKYESVLRDPEGLSWELGGATVRCMTEEEFVASSGKREHTSKPNPMAQRWADSMTGHYAELAVKEPVFGQLRNCMELAVVGALVAHERLTDRAGCSLPLLLDDVALKTLEYTAPAHVDSKVSMLKKGHNWIISASGGVAIQPGEILGKAQKSEAPAAARAKALAADSAKWYWN